MIQLLVVGQTIFGIADGYQETDTSIVLSDITYPKNAVNGWQIVQVASLPDDFSIGKYTYANGDVVKKPLAADVLLVIKNDLIEKVNLSIANVYDKWQRFTFEYTEREKAARAFKDAGYVGDAGAWITSYASNISQSNTVAANLIIQQADGLRQILESLGALRMEKYKILYAADEVSAKSQYDTIMATFDQLVASLP